MSKAKIVYRDIMSGRLITQKEAATRNPETWIEEIFVQPKPTIDERNGTDLPSVKHLDGSAQGS